MSVYIAYRAEGVAPICRRIAALDPRLIAINDRELEEGRLRAQRTPLPPVEVPPDPALGQWERAQQMAEDFTNVGRDHYRSPVALAGVNQLGEALRTLGEALRTPPPVALLPPLPPFEPHVLIRWGSRWVGGADVEINSATSVSNARDKRTSRRLLAGICPETWDNLRDIRLPLVVRPRVHFGGNRLFVCRTLPEVHAAVRRCGIGWYAAELVDKVREFRVFILQGRALSVSERFPGQDPSIAWNLHAGGRVARVQRRNWPLDVVRTAIEAARRVNLDFTAVDLALLRDGRVMVFETNTAPGVTTERGRQRLAHAFASIPLEPTLPLLNLERINHWRDVIHPALWTPDEAPR